MESKPYANLRANLLKQYGKDPLYREVILADNSTFEQKKAALISLRGISAYRLLQESVRQLLKKENDHAV